VQRVWIVAAEAEVFTAPATPKPNNPATAVDIKILVNIFVSLDSQSTLRWTYRLSFDVAAAHIFVWALVPALRPTWRQHRPEANERRCGEFRSLRMPSA
jgi:hypothetical protein